VQNNALKTPIFLAQADDAENNVGINLGNCPRTTCSLLGVAWLPDGSGFVFARAETSFDAKEGVLYRYDFASEEASEILRLPSEFIGRVALSPDGNTIIFERDDQLTEAVDEIYFGPRLICPCELWLVGIDGSNPRLLVEDGRAPAWSPVAPTVEPPPGGSDALRLYVPFVTG
jgi:Tol biopolymer transport system component